MGQVEIRRRGRRWLVKAVAQGRARAKVGTLGDAKRAGEALAQQPLIWERRTGDRWVGRLPSVEERQAIRHAGHWRADERAGYVCPPCPICGGPGVVDWVPVDDVGDEPGTWWVPGTYDCQRRCGGTVEVSRHGERRVSRMTGVG